VLLAHTRSAGIARYVDAITCRERWLPPLSAAQSSAAGAVAGDTPLPSRCCEAMRHFVDPHGSAARPLLRE